MNNIKYFAISAAIALTSFASFAAEPVNQQQSQRLTEIGVISVGHASTLSSLETKLAAEADAQGASSYRIIATTGNNLMHGTAVIYK
ncbi:MULTISPECIES: YdgH/BhsA/McbA-like domain containing protein [unclassified Serratia (in: enterobacteria)]|uniref:multiple stress resistance protein BhsA n=1 Tax=unclassified Serratia (in: enterobacteria) TaxID=2647522 RepID=UPI000507BA91|nr:MULTISPECIES: YdgH/BhsA/McbA-like domain containing protein [unclassified Serratia (in: enterobacteria)]KFK94517.1 membrane protein [Serratia sp. Ag2]KFK95737.1 membrane protein [Serratia sp. Ag1]